MAQRLTAIRQPRHALPWAVGTRTARVKRAVQGAAGSWFVGLIGLTVLIAVCSGLLSDEWPLSAYVIPLLFAINVLSMPRLLVLEAVMALCVSYSLWHIDVTTLRLVGAGVIVLAGAIVSLHVRSRSHLGVPALRSDSMLIDLRDRLATQSRLPELPRGWHAEAVMRPAGGASFSGDFIVASRTGDGGLLEVVVVDVSGKGLAAGTRSLQLSGAFGGLLGSLPPQDFLGAANGYVLRQDWSEGFATAVHLTVDLASGAFAVRTAGHPPAVQLHAGSGRWEPLLTSGPVLGVMGRPEYTEHNGLLRVGDTILLYTDGLVERPDREIVFGIDKLLGEAEALVREGFEGAAQRLIDSVDFEDDDRAIMVLRRV